LNVPMLRSLRRIASPIAVLTLAATAALSGANVVPHAGACHDDCAPAVVAHDASLHQVQSGTTTASTEPEHCLVCHWARSFRLKNETRIVLASQGIGRVLVRVSTVPVPRSTSVVLPPLRSPPSVPPVA
jgi:hypothetical protein